MNVKDSIQQFWNTHPEWAAAAQQEGVDTNAGKLPCRAVLFDMDGVLFDSMPLHAKAWVEAVGEFGLPMEALEVYMNEGRTALSTINVLTQRTWGRDTTAEETERIYARKCEIFNQYPEAPKMKGADEVLAVVKNSNKERVVVTGSGQLSLINKLTTHYPKCFSPEKLVSSKDVRYGKPHPEPYLMGLEKVGLRPWEAIVIENAPLGVRAAVAAQIFTIAVNTGPLPMQALKDEGANLVFDSMTDLAQFLNEILAE